MDAQFVQRIQSYNYHGRERKIAVGLLTELDKINCDFSAWNNDLQQKKEEARQVLENTQTQIREVEQIYTAHNSKVNSLEKKIEEKKLEVKKLDGLNQQYLIRKEKATARLSQADLDFIDSLEKRLLAFQHMTGVIWDYPSCMEGHLSGYIRNMTSKKVKFFQGNLDPNELWQLIEKVSK